MHYDPTNDRLGIQNATPGFPLTVNGKIGVDTMQVVYYPGAAFPGTMIYGNAGANMVNSKGAENTIVGDGAGYNLTTGIANTIVGRDAAQRITTAESNNAFGWQALKLLTTGSSNSAFGSVALSSTTTGGYNAAFGESALASNVIGSFNSSFGAYSLSFSTSSNNAAFGSSSLGSASSGANNTAVGANALFSITTGSDNVGIGYEAGRRITNGGSHTTGAKGVYIGSGARASANGNSNEIAIGYAVRGNGSNTVTIGNDTITATHLKGQLKLPQYATNNYTAAASKLLAVDASGNVVEVDTIASGGGGGVGGTVAANKVAFGAPTGDTLTSNTNLHWDNTNGRLGIGLINPLAKLHIQGAESDLPVTGVAVLENFPNITANSNDVIAALTNTLFTPILNTYNYNILIGNGNRVFHRGSGNVNQLRGLNLVTRHQGSGVVTTMYGANYESSNEGTGKVSDLIGNNISVNNSADTVTNAYGVYHVGYYSGKVANTYGVYVGDITGAGNINKPFSFYASDPDADNFFNGNTGLGTTTPATKLHLKTVSAENKIRIETETSGNPVLELLASGNQMYSFTGDRTNNYLKIHSTAYDFITMNAANGNVGIGTTSPSSILSLSGQAAQTFGMERHATANTAGNGLTIQAGGATSESTDKTGGALFLSSGTATGNARSVIVLSTPTPGSSGTADNAPVERVRINNTGMGVGTNNPQERLHVSGNVRMTGNLQRAAPVTVAASTHTLAETTSWLIVNNAGTCTVTLPAASTWTGREVTIKTITANTVVSASSNVVPIDGDTAGTAILPATDGAWAKLVSDGTNWIIMQKG